MTDLQAVVPPVVCVNNVLITTVSMHTKCNLIANQYIYVGPEPTTKQEPKRTHKYSNRRQCLFPQDMHAPVCTVMAAQTIGTRKELVSGHLGSPCWTCMHRPHSRQLMR